MSLSDTVRRHAGVVVCIFIPGYCWHVIHMMPGVRPLRRVRQSSNFIRHTLCLQASPGPPHASPRPAAGADVAAKLPRPPTPAPRPAPPATRRPGDPPAAAKRKLQSMMTPCTEHTVSPYPHQAHLVIVSIAVSSIPRGLTTRFIGIRPPCSLAAELHVRRR